MQMARPDLSQVGGVSGAGGEGKWSRSRIIVGTCAKRKRDLRQKVVGPATQIVSSRPAVAQVGGANGAGPGKTGGPAPKGSGTCDANRQHRACSGAGGGGN